MKKTAIRSRCFYFSLFLLMAFLGHGVRAENEPATTPPSFSLSKFRIGLAGIVSEADLESSYSVSASWNPEWDFAPGWNLGLNLGTLLLSQLPPNHPVAVEYQLTLGRVLLTDVWFELGGGAQSWTAGLATSPLLSATFYYRFPDAYWGFLDRAYITYSSFLVPGLYVNELKLGFGVGF